MPRQNSGMPSGYGEVVSGVNEWNQNFLDSYGGAQDYAQNNQWAQGFAPYYNSMLSGSMENNPWMSRLYGQTANLDMNEGLANLRSYIGGNTGGRGGSGSSSGSSGGGGRPRPVNIPDSTVGDNFFSTHINELFDPARLDPANDPTLQPTADAISREAEQDYWRSVADLTNMMEGAGRYGGSTYQAMRTNANEQYNEALQATMSDLYRQAREAALARQQEALGMVNTRDISQGQINAQLEAARMQAAESAAARGSQLQAAREANRLQAIGMMLDAGQFGMSTGANMASLMQQGQLGAGQLGLGFGQLGLSGYDTSANFGQLGLGAMGQLGNIYSSAASNRLAQQQAAEEQRRWNEQAPIRDIGNLVDIMRGLNDIGGYNYQEPYIPSSSGPSPQGFGFGDALGSAINGLGAYYGTSLY